MELKDLKLEYFDFDTPTEGTAVPEYNDCANESCAVVSRVAYLIGVEKRHFDNGHEPLMPGWYAELSKDKRARIVRNLCMLRTAIEQNYEQLYRAMTADVKNLNTLPEYIPQEAISELEKDGIRIVKPNARPLQYIIEMNRLISDRINNCRELFPLWLNWEYIRQLFIMPNGTTEVGAKRAANEYYARKNSYPYQVYINWNGGGNGNILFNDKKFVSLLYESHEDCFWDLSKVTDAGNVTKKGIYSFLENSERTAIVVDCENSDPYKVHAMLTNLDQEALLNRICKITLYDDIHTTSAWNVLNEFTEIPVEHRVIERIKEGKSLVDATLMLGAAKDFYTNDVDSFILLSSDSDYWSLIRELGDARFFVMVESGKCGPDIKRALATSGVSYCYLDDFCTGDSGIVIRTLLSEVREAIDSQVCFNVRRILDDAIYDTRAELSEKERRQFYDRYLKKLKLTVDIDGEVRIELGD